MISEKAYAKINLTLDVVRKRPDSYHDIKSVMVSAELFDELKFIDSEERLIVCNNPRVPLSEKNLCWKAVDKVKEKFNIDKEVKIVIEKNIPVGAGLAGGSADAATTILALNELWELGLGEKEMIRIAKELGMDVPFCIIGSACLATERGEILERIRLPSYDIVIVNPGFETTSKEAYTLFDEANLRSKNSTDAFLEQRDVTRIGNDLESEIAKKHRVIEVIKQELMEKGAIVSSMSGSGPTVFGIFENEEKAERAYAELRKRHSFCWSGKTR